MDLSLQTAFSGIGLARSFFLGRSGISLLPTQSLLEQTTDDLRQKRAAVSRIERFLECLFPKIGELPFEQDCNDVILKAWFHLPEPSFIQDR